MPASQIEAKGFFATLFDFGFTSYLTLKFLRVIYAVLVVLILLTGAVVFLASISRGGIYTAIAIFVVPVVTLIYLVLMRISLEAIALFFRIGENTTLIAASAGGVARAGEGLGSGLPGPYYGSPDPGSVPPSPHGPAF